MPVVDSFLHVYTVDETPKLTEKCSKIAKFEFKKINLTFSPIFVMSKNTGSAAFRKIDVDAYNEDAYREEDEAETPGLGPDETEVTNLLNQNRHHDALKSALRNPPLKTRNQAIKDRAVQLMIRVLCAFKQSDVEKNVQMLDKEQQELLMKYIYKGFEFPQDNSSAVLLVWHEKLVQCSGLGSIVRVLTDRKCL